MERKIIILTWLVIVSMILQVALFLLLGLNLKSRQADAYSEYLGAYRWKQKQNCFDASLNGYQVGKCLGLPGYGTEDYDPTFYSE